MHNLLPANVSRYWKWTIYSALQMEAHFPKAPNRTCGWVAIAGAKVLLWHPPILVKLLQLILAQWRHMAT